MVKIVLLEFYCLPVRLEIVKEGTRIRRTALSYNCHSTNSTNSKLQVKPVPKWNSYHSKLLNISVRTKINLSEYQFLRGRTLFMDTGWEFSTWLKIVLLSVLVSQFYLCD